MKSNNFRIRYERRIGYWIIERSYKILWFKLWLDYFPTKGFLSVKKAEKFLIKYKEEKMIKYL